MVNRVLVVLAALVGVGLPASAQTPAPKATPDTAAAIATVTKFYAWYRNHREFGRFPAPPYASGAAAYFTPSFFVDAKQGCEIHVIESDLFLSGVGKNWPSFTVGKPIVKGTKILVPIYNGRTMTPGKPDLWAVVPVPSSGVYLIDDFYYRWPLSDVEGEDTARGQLHYCHTH